MKNYHIFCDCNNFGWKVSKDIERNYSLILKNIEFEIGCQLLSVFSYTHWSDKDKLIEFCTSLFKSSGSAKKKLCKRQLFSSEGIIKSWDILLKYKSYCSKQKIDLDTQIKNVIKLIVYSQTMHVKYDDMDPSDMLVTGSINDYRDNLGLIIPRGRFVYTESKGLSPEDIKLKSDMEEKFQKKYQVALKEYCIVLSAVISRFNELNVIEFNELRSRSFYEKYPLNLHKSLVNFEQHKKDAFILMDSLSIKSNVNTGYEDDEGSSFIDKYIKQPFFCLQNGTYIPITRKWAEDLLWISLYYKIAECYNNKVEFYNFFGRLFENYVRFLTKETCRLNENSYQFIDEFEYGKPKKRSPDVMISNFNNNINTAEVLVVEAKSARLLYDLKSNRQNEESIEISLKKVVEDPLAQARKVIKNIIDKKAHDEITEEKLYCIICVTMENIPFKAMKSEEFSNILTESKFKCVQIAICIEEFEMLMQLLSQKERNSIANEIVNYCIKSENTLVLSGILSFKNYLNRYTNYRSIALDNGIIQKLMKEYGWVYPIDFLPQNRKTRVIPSNESCY